ncbi:putative RNA-directed DNA polymerase from transposon X-element [Trichonephila clavipes]|nr:putative RNA-directed DNA polymerase from transposon X-element [Trichonephila clavipes]
MNEILDLTPAMELDTELNNGMDNNDERHPMENEPPLPQDDSAPELHTSPTRGRTTGAVFLDIQKAFDRVWIDGLIYKLITYNFPPAIIHILYSYLTNRKYKVRVNDTLSITHRVNIGVTQGSLFGTCVIQHLR